MDKIFEPMVMFKSLCIPNSTQEAPSPTTRGRVSINFKWFNTKVYLVNSLFGEKLCRDFCPGSDAGVQLVIGY